MSILSARPGKENGAARKPLHRGTPPHRNSKGTAFRLFLYIRVFSCVMNTRHGRSVIIGLKIWNKYQWFSLQSKSFYPKQELFDAAQIYLWAAFPYKRGRRWQHKYSMQSLGIYAALCIVVNCSSETCSVGR